MLDDYEEAHFGEGPQEEEPEATTKAFYEMLEAAQKPLHGQTKVSQLDGIGRLMALKSQFGLSRDAFDSMLTVFWQHASRRSHSAQDNVSGDENP